MINNKNSAVTVNTYIYFFPISVCNIKICGIIITNAQHVRHFEFEFHIIQSSIKEISYL